MEEIKLNNQATIPVIGIGTFLLSPQEAEQSVKSALKNGYTMIDTANAYMNEKAVGRGMKSSGLRREEIFLSTKLWPSVYAKAEQAIDETLARLDTSYIDLLFLHQPVGDYIGAYKAIEKAVKAGKVKAIGLSNFDDSNLDKLKEIIAQSEIKPAFVQVEAHPYYQQNELKKYIEQYGTRLMARYPLGHGDAGLLKEPVFAELAKKYGKTTAQIILRWHTQVGNVVIPGSKNEDHIKDNINIFDFRLNDDEMALISTLDKGSRYYVSSEEALQGYLAFAPDFDSQE